LAKPLTFETFIQYNLPVYPGAQGDSNMKRFVLAIALSGLLSVTVLAGEVPINGAPAPAPPQPTTTAQSASVSTVLTNVVLTIFTLIGR